MANTLTPEEAAKVRELESQLDFLKVQKNPEPVKAEPAETKQEAAAPAQEQPLQPSAHNPLLAADSREQAQARKPGEMSPLDRARASRFAPPKHMAAADNTTAANKEETKEQPKAETEKKDTPERPKPESPKPVGPKPVSPKPVTIQASAPQPALKLAMTVEEAKKQGLIAPGTYGKPEENTDVPKGDTKEIPTIPEPVSITEVPAKEPEKPKAQPAEPIKNPLPVPKKHVAKDMDFDLDVPAQDMHFDVVDMSGIDFFDIN